MVLIMNDFIEKKGIIDLEEIFFIEKPIELCKLSYPGHKKGCPNIVKNLDRKIPYYKKCKNCPPYAKRLSEKYYLFFNNTYLIYVKFNLKKQVEKMKSLYPNWSYKQCKCLLYWQKPVVKILKQKVEWFIEEIKMEDDKEIDYKYDYELIPEAMGLNVFKTMKYYDIILERNPQNCVYKVAFVGVLK
jgi:hypothetical protein